MKPAAKPEVVISTKIMRIVAVPIEYDGGEIEQDRNVWDIWRDREACREVRIEVASGKDAMGAPIWRRLDFDGIETFHSGHVRSLALGMLELLDQTGALGDTAAMRSALRGEVKP